MADDLQTNNPDLSSDTSSMAPPPQQAPAAPAQQQAQPVPANVPHSRLINMIQGLALGADSFATSVATGGKEGGYQEVQAANAARQKQQEDAQKAQQEQLEGNLRMKAMQAQLVQSQGAYQHNLQMWPSEERNAAITAHNSYVDSILHDQDATEKLGLDTDDPTQAAIANHILNGAKTVQIPAGQDAATTHKSISQAASEDGKSITDYTPLVQHEGDTMGNGATVTLALNDTLRKIPATDNQLNKAQSALETTNAALNQALKTQPDIADRPEYKAFLAKKATFENTVKSGGKLSVFDANAMLTDANGTAANLVSGAANLDKQRKAQAETVKSEQDALASQRPKDLNDAVGRMVQAQQTYAAQPTPENKQAVSNAKDARQAFLSTEASQERVKQAITDGNPQDLSQGLVTGIIAPSQILSSRKPEFAQAAFKAANDYSMKTTGQPWNMAKADAQFKYASNPQTQNTLNMIEGMTEKGGSIEIATQAASKLPQLDEATANKVFNATEKEFGSSGITNFHTAMLGLADEYSKVMGGGVSSDSGRQQALDLLRDSYSKGQLSGAIDIMQKDIAGRKVAMVRDNPTLKALYPDTAPQVQQSAGHKVNDIIMQNGVPFRVKAVDANGKATAADPQ